MAKDGRSLNPFQPNQPVSPGLFVGREQCVQRILNEKSPTSKQVDIFYISGRSKIGKTSFANYCRVLLEKDPTVLGFHTFLASSNPKTTKEIIYTTVNNIIHAKAFTSNWSKKIIDFFHNYVIEVSLSVIKVKKSALKQDIPTTGSEFLVFLREFGKKMYPKKKNWCLLLTFDELDGITTKPFFSTFLKELTEANAVVDNNNKISLIILLCGVRQGLSSIEKNNKSLGQTIRLLKIQPLERDEVKTFFVRAFRKVGLEITPRAIELLVDFSEGLPQWMHLIGEAILRKCGGTRIDTKEASRGLLSAAIEMGRGYDQQKVNDLMARKEYSFITEKLSKSALNFVFTRQELLQDVTKEQRKVVDRFLQSLKKLKLIENGLKRGEWRFVDRLGSLYLNILARADCTTR